MITISIPTGEPSERQISQICDAVYNGDVIIIPTDTIYAICCDALNAKAIERVCKIKHINPDKTNLSIICCDIAQASEYARIDNSAFRFMKEYTPGPITFLLRAASSLPRTFKGRKTVGVRIPDAAIPVSITRRLQRPLLTTSVEFDSDDFAISPGLIAEQYESLVDVMVAGPDGDTIPSTIVDLRDGSPEVIREGKAQID